MEPRLILVTRPMEQAAEFAAEIESLGAEPVICSLLDIHPLFCDLTRFSIPDVLLVTSQQVFSVGLDLSSFYSCPIFCVGERTGDLARKYGFANVRVADGDVHSLVSMVQQNFKPSARLLYLRGDDVRADLKTLLTEYSVDEAIVYKADAIFALPQNVVRLFPRLDTICLFSPRSGVILRGLMEKHGLTSFARSINLLSLSGAVLESVSDLGWKTSHVADRPDVRSMISDLTLLLDQT